MDLNFGKIKTLISRGLFHQINYSRSLIEFSFQKCSSWFTKTFKTFKTRIVSTFLCSTMDSSLTTVRYIFFSRVRACKTRQQKERERNGKKKTSFSVPTIFSQKRALALLRVRKVRRQTNERTNVPLLFDFIFRPRFHFFLLFVFPFPSPSLE